MTEQVRNALIFLQEQYPERTNLKVEELAQLTNHDVKTVRNMICANELPGKVSKGRNSKRMFTISLISVAQWLADDNKLQFGTGQYSYRG